MKIKTTQKPLSKQLLIRMTPAERTTLEVVARREQRSLAAQARVLLARSLEQLQAAA